VTDREPTLPFHEGKRKYLFCLDHRGAEAALPLFPVLIERRLPFETRVLSSEAEWTHDELYKWFSAQKMGTFLYIAGRPELVEQATEQAYAAGFSDEEMCALVMSARTLRVFCVVCEENVNVPPAKQVNCPLCGNLLTVTDHFSPRLRAFLGYVPVT
jgi:hypothetical protein